LTLSDISGGTWVDCGCGRGTFTFPLSSLASRVIALDKNSSNISYLKSQLQPNANIEVYEKDFNNESLYHELVDGVLFGFSLHYHPNPNKALQNAYEQLKLNGMVIVFEYSRSSPLPWVPYPISKQKLSSQLKNVGFSRIKTVLEKRRFYIAQGVKITVESGKCLES
jgi:ubiquinone/menaquinone biosynthesis C-methylase UbiE